MKFLRLPAGIYQANCYIVFNEKSNDGFIIDPGGDGPEILKLIKDQNIKVKFIILTHGHFDHTGAVNYLISNLNIPVFINEKDNELIKKGSLMFNFFPSFEEVEADRFIKNGDVLSFGDEYLEVIETPGHTPGGITIMVDESIFTGDTLFLGSVGRTDLPGGSYEVLIQSIKERLLVLPDETRVYPGHGNSTTIEREKKLNHFLK